MEKIITFRRYHLDNLLSQIDFYGKVLDVGGKKINKRGKFRPPINNVISWEYLNTDESTNPDYIYNAEKIGLDSASFDFIVLTEVLEHLENPILALKECNRLLKKSGTLILTMPFLYGIHGDPNDFQRWTPSKFNLELTKVGFKEIEILTMGGFFAVLFDLLRMSLGTASKNRKPL